MHEWLGDTCWTPIYGEIYHTLRRQGRHLSQVDMMLAALAIQMNVTLMTTDRDFESSPICRPKTGQWMTRRGHIVVLLPWPVGLDTGQPARRLPVRAGTQEDAVQDGVTQVTRHEETGMSKRATKHRDHPDPEYQRWGRMYPRFPGVAECMRLIRTGKAKGAWADIIVHELAEHASVCLSELVATFHSDCSDEVRLYVMMALELAQPPEAVPFLVEVLRQGDARFAPYSERTLRAIDTAEARRFLWNTHDDFGADR
jgi:hypothetical protein